MASKTNINSETARNELQNFLKDDSKWIKSCEGERLLKLRINDKDETIVHYAIQNCKVEWAKLLFDFRSFSRLLSDQNLEKNRIKIDKNRKKLEEHELRKFLFIESTSGENALYQCLQKLDSKNQNENLKEIVMLFIDSSWDLITDPNFYINKRVGYKTTILHLLIEREQLNLLENFIECYECGDYSYDSLDFMKKDHQNKTPLMLAFETGNKSIIKLIHAKSKSNLVRKQSKEFVTCLNKAKKDKDGQLKQLFLENKLLISKQAIDLKSLKDALTCLEQEKQYNIELDASSFESIWLEYLVQAKIFKVAISKKDVDYLASDMNKQILINRINKKISEKYILVTIFVLNYVEYFEQLNNFVKYLPFNFKIVFCSPFDEASKFDFYIKQAHFQASHQLNCFPDTNSNPPENDDYISQFISKTFRSIHDNDNVEDIKIVLKFVNKKLEPNIQSQYFEKLGDFYANLVINSCEASRFYKKAIDSYFSKEDDHFAELLIKAGEFLLKSSIENEEESRNYFSKALDTITNNSQSTSLIAKCYESFAICFKLRGKHDEQIDWLEEALKIYIIVENHENAARVRNFIFCAYCAKDQIHELAIENLNKSNKFYLSSSLDNVAMAYYNYGKAYEVSSDIEQKKKAIENYNKSIENYKQFYDDQDQIEIANAHYNIGLIYEELEEFKLAAESLETALEIFEAIYRCDHKNIAMVLNNLGTCYPNNASEQTKSLFATVRIDNLIESHKMYERLECKDDVAMTAYNLGIEYLELGMYEKAKKYFEKSLELYRNLEEKNEVEEIEKILDGFKKSEQHVLQSVIIDELEQQLKYNSILDIITELEQQLKYMDIITQFKQNLKSEKNVMCCKKNLIYRVNPSHERTYLQPIGRVY